MTVTMMKIIIVGDDDDDGGPVSIRGRESVLNQYFCVE